MAKTRIYELARALNMTNQALLEKLVEMGIEVKSHMSSLDEDMVEKVKQELFAGGGGQTAVVEKKRVGSNVIRKRKQKAAPKIEVVSETPEKAEEPEVPEAEEAAAPEKEEKAAIEPEAVVEEEAAKAEETVDEVVEEEVEADAEAPTREAETVEEPAAVEASKPAAEEEAEKPAPPPKKKTKAKKHQAAKIIKFADETTQALIRGKTSPPPARVKVRLKKSRPKMLLRPQCPA